MVKNLLFLLIVILLLYGSCDFIQSTPFDLGESLLLISQSIDSYIPANVEYYQLNILDNDDTKYLFLYMEYGSGSVGRKVVILDEYLRVRGSYDDNGMSIQLGRLNMVDANRNFVVGTTIFNEDLMPIFNVSTIFSLSTIGINEDSFGFADDYSGTGVNYIFEIDNVAFPPELQYDIFNPDWSTAGSSSRSVGTALNYYLIKATYDHNRSLISFIFSGSEYNDTTYYSIFFNNIFFPDNLGVINLMDHPSNKSFSDLNSDSISYTEDGIAGAYENYGLKLISLTTGNTIEEYEDWDWENLVYAYDLTGEYFYFFDKNDNRIYKYYTWWDE